MTVSSKNKYSQISKFYFKKKFFKIYKCREILNQMNKKYQKYNNNNWDYLWPQIIINEINITVRWETNRSMNKPVSPLREKIGILSLLK